MSFNVDLTTSTRGISVASLSFRSRRGFRVSKHVAALTLGFLLSACTRTLQLPLPDTLPSPAGPMIDVAPVTDDRTSSKLGKLDTFTIDSGPELVSYVEAELMNGLATMGLAVRQVDPSAAPTGLKRLQVTLLSAELSSESTALKPVVAAVRFRVELTDETGKSTFRKDFRGSTSRKLLFHTQGGPEHAKVLTEAISQAVGSLAADRSLRAAASASQTDASRPQASGTNAAHRGPSGEPPTNEPAKSVAERLSTLDQLLKEGLIDQDDYAAKRKEILDDL